MVYHFAALVDPGRSRQQIYRANVVGTRNFWECAACGVKKALYCSSTAVYGRLAHSHGPISEEVRPRAVEQLEVAGGIGGIRDRRPRRPRRKTCQ